MANRSGKRFILDTSCEALGSVLEAKSFLIESIKEELEKLTLIHISTEEDIIDGVKSMLKKV